MQGTPFNIATEGLLGGILAKISFGFLDVAKIVEIIRHGTGGRILYQDLTPQMNLVPIQQDENDLLSLIHIWMDIFDA